MNKVNKNNNDRENSTQFLNIKQSAVLISVSVGTICILTNKKVITSMRVGRNPWYKKSDILKLVNNDFQK